MKKPPGIHALVLASFCLGLGTVLAVTDRLTADEIAARAHEDRVRALGEVLPPAHHDNDPLDDVPMTTAASGATACGKTTASSRCCSGCARRWR